MKAILYATILAFLVILLIKHYAPSLNGIDLHPQQSQQLQQISQ